MCVSVYVQSSLTYAPTLPLPQTAAEDLVALPPSLPLPQTAAAEDLVALD